MLKTKHLKIVLNSNVGNINQKKADSLSDIFRDDFDVKILQEQPIGNVFILANPINREVILIEPTKVTYQYESDESINPDFGSVSHNLEKLFNTLLLDEQSAGLIHFVGSIEEKSGNSMASSLETLMPNQDLKSLIPNLKGVGLRFLIEHHTGLWEYKIEPQINDSRFYFVEMICNVNKEINKNEIIELAKEFYADFTDGKNNVLEMLGI